MLNKHNIYLQKDKGRCWQQKVVTSSNKEKPVRNTEDEKIQLHRYSLRSSQRMKCRAEGQIGRHQERIRI